MTHRQRTKWMPTHLMPRKTPQSKLTPKATQQKTPSSSSNSDNDSAHEVKKSTWSHRSLRSLQNQDNNKHTPQSPAHACNSQPLLELVTSPTLLSPFMTTPMSKVPSPTIGNHQNHNNNTRIGSPGPPPTHHALGQTTSQASHKHTPRT